MPRCKPGAQPGLAVDCAVVGLAPGGRLDEHDAAGPITIHVVEGELELTAGGKTRNCATGALIALHRRVRHAVRSQGGAMFLLTLSTTNSNAEPQDIRASNSRRG